MSACGVGEGLLDVDPGADEGAEAGLAVPGKDPIGFGVAGTHTVDWRTDGRSWTYNWGWDPDGGVPPAPGAVFLPMIWGGPFCARWGDLRQDRLDAVPRYRASVCADARCRMDAREVQSPYGRPEVIFAKGVRHEFVDGVLTSAVDATSVPRYCGAKDAEGRCTAADRPCFRKRAGECRMETLAFATVGSEKWESLTYEGRYFNFELTTGAFRGSGLLTSVERYCGPKDAAGTCLGMDRPCFGRKGADCRFDTRTVTPAYESITAYGKYFNYQAQGPWALVGTDDLKKVDRYRFGGCAGAGAGQPCVLDTRSLAELEPGNEVESITAVHAADVGRYFLWYPGPAGSYCAPGDASLAFYLQYNVDGYIAKYPGPGQRWLMLNEPDVASQANMPPEHAAEVYALVANRILARDPTARLYCCGTAPAACNTPDCRNWLRRFMTALNGRAPVHAVHMHNYATSPGQPFTFSDNGSAVIAEMIRFSDELQTMPSLAGKPIVVSEWGGLSNDPARMCGPGVNNRDDIMTPVASWLIGPGKSRYRYQAAAWFVDHCSAGRDCSLAATLYQPPATTRAAAASGPPQCGPTCQRTCLGEKFFRDVAPTWR